MCIKEMGSNLALGAEKRANELPGTTGERGGKV